MAVIVKLKHLSPFHIGTGKENYDFSSSMLQSDTLSAALAAMRVQKGEKDDVESFLDSFTVSSAFPYYGKILFMPKPNGRISVNVTDTEEYSSRKKLKKVQFVEFDLWKQLLMGKTLNITSSQLKDCFLLSTKSTSDFVIPYKSQVNQRVSVPRNDGADAEPFFFDWTYYQENAGLYCLLDAPDNMIGELLDLFQLLGETGLGTDKNVGGGKFEVDRNTEWIDFDFIETANASMLLSLYIPTEQEVGMLNLPESRYELVLRGGYMAGSDEEDFKHLRKKSVYAFSVGSIFPTTAKLSGKIVDLKPSWNDEHMHPVYRSGKPFFVPIKVNEL